MEIKVNELNLEINMSNVNGIDEMVEDEVINKKIKMKMRIENIKICLNEDSNYGKIN
jgi:hypothetical protein